MTGEGIEARLSPCGLQMTDYSYKRQQDHPAEPHQPTRRGKKKLAVVSATKFRMSRGQ